jgi:hypothetical protein
MAEGEGRTPGEHSVTKVMHEVQVGVAQPGSGHLDDYLPGTGRGDLDVD